MKKIQMKCKDCSNFDLDKKKETKNCSYEDVTLDEDICEDFIHIDESQTTLIKKRIAGYIFNFNAVGVKDNSYSILTLKKGRKLLAELENINYEELRNIGRLFLAASKKLKDHVLIKEGFEGIDILKKRGTILIQDAKRIKIFFDKSNYHGIDKEKIYCDRCSFSHSSFKSDGIYLWSKTFEHKVLYHLVRPSKEFLQHVRSKIKLKNKKKGVR